MKIFEPNQIICGHTPEVLKTLPDDFVDCVITSPPYWGLRDYGIEAQVWPESGSCGDGNGDCEHRWGSLVRMVSVGSSDKSTLHDGKGRKETEKYVGDNKIVQSGFCSLCGAWKGSLGLEPTPELYIKHLADIFDEVKRVLKKTGQ